MTKNVVLKSKLNPNGLTKERIAEGLKNPSPVRNEMKDMLNKLNEIEEKSKCLRVQFLDWLSDKLLNWSNRCHEMSVRIDSPCVIKVEPRKREESQHAKESKEIARLKVLLKEAQAKGKI